MGFVFDIWIEKFNKISKLAKDDNIKLRGSISCCFTCPYEGDIYVDKVRDVIKRYNDIGVDRIDIADSGERNDDADDDSGGIMHTQHIIL